MGARDMDRMIWLAFIFSEMMCEVVDIKLLDCIKREKFLDIITFYGLCFMEVITSYSLLINCPDKCFVMRGPWILRVRGHVINK
jgi:tellurite resistance protein TehA-like permease